jgi:hypothetical protein
MATGIQRYALNAADTDQVLVGLRINRVEARQDCQRLFPATLPKRLSTCASRK